MATFVSPPSRGRLSVVDIHDGPVGPGNLILTEDSLDSFGIRLPYLLIGDTGYSVPAGDLTDLTGPKPDPAASDRVVWHGEGHAANDQLILTWRCQVRAALGDWPTNAFTIDLWRDDATNVEFSLETEDTTGAVIDTKTPTPGASTWGTTTVTAADLAAGTYTQGSVFTIRLTVTLDSGDNAYVARPISGA